MGETTPRDGVSLVAPEAPQPAGHMEPLTPPIYGLSLGRLVVVCDSRLPQPGNVELHAGVLLLGHLVGLMWSRTRTFPTQICLYYSLVLPHEFHPKRTCKTR